jgi:hypothetical protein
MPTVNTKKVGGAKAKAATKAKPKANAVAKKAAGTNAKAKTAKTKAAAAIVKKEEPKTITFKLPAGAHRVENPELPDILKGVSGFEVKASYVFDVPVSFGSVPTRPNPHNVGADNGPKGSLGWTLANAHAKDSNGQYLVDDVDPLKSAMRPLLNAVLVANGTKAASDAKISIPDGIPSDQSLEQLEAERRNAGLPNYPDRNYYAVQINSDLGTWTTAVHPKDLNGAGGSAGANAGGFSVDAYSDKSSRDLDKDVGQILKDISAHTGKTVAIARKPDRIARGGPPSLDFTQNPRGLTSAGTYFIEADRRQVGEVTLFMGQSSHLTAATPRDLAAAILKLVQ